MNSAELEHKAFRIQAVVEEHTLQQHGMLPMFVRASDFQLPTAPDYAGMAPHRHLKGKTEEEVGIAPMHIWRAWEDTSADTGFYLGAMSYRYRCTGAAADLAVCRRTLGALKYIYDIGAESEEPGFLTKPYGGVASTQTSGDQLQSVTMGLDAYRRIACGEDAATIDAMFVGFADYQMRRQYAPKQGSYFALLFEPRDWISGSWGRALIYLPVLFAAWRATGDGKFVGEIERLYRCCESDDSCSPEPGERVSSGGKGLYLPSLMMELDPWHHQRWRDMMMGSFRTSAHAILPDGTGYTAGRNDPQTGTVVPVASRWGGGTARTARTGRYSSFGFGCVNAQRWLPEEDAVGVARVILENLDLDTFRFIMPAEPGGQLDHDWRPEGKLLDHDSLVGWLYMYWEGRWRGYW